MDKIEDWSYNYVKMDCQDKDRCYGVLAVSSPTDLQGFIAWYRQLIR